MKGQPQQAEPKFYTDDLVYAPTGSGFALGKVIRGRDRYARYLVAFPNGLVVVAFESELRSREDSNGT